MKPWNTFAALCGYLRAGLLGDVAPSPAADNSWPLLIEASSHHYVTPALAWCLRGQAGIPSEIGDYFDAALTLNGQRNERLIAALVRIVAALNAIDIEPILLKGAARLVDGIYPSPKLRFLGDLDILIPADRSAEAVAALKCIGFDEHDPTPHYHHLPMLHERDTGAGVELHTKLSDPPYDAIISAAWFWENTKSFQLQDLRVRLPDATRSAAHTIVHDQLHHLNYQSSRLQLRQLLDLAMIRARYESTIDWTELDHRFCSVGMGQALATYLEFAKVLLGQHTPQLSHVPRAGALADFRRMIEPSIFRRLAKVARIPIGYVSVRRRDPLGVIRLISPRTWSTGIRLVKTALGKAKW